MMAQMNDRLARDILTNGAGVTRHEVEQLARHWLGLYPQQRLMRYCPCTGQLTPYPSDAKQFRAHHGKAAWLFNPWTGCARTPQDIGSDTFGELILPPESELAS